MKKKFIDNGKTKIVLPKGKLGALKTIADCEKPYASNCLSGNSPFTPRCKQIREIAIKECGGKIQKLIDPLK